MQETADLITFAEEILNGKLHFLCSERRELAVPMKIYPTSVSTIEVRNSTVRFEVDLAGFCSVHDKTLFTFYYMVFTIFFDSFWPLASCKGMKCFF